MDTNVITKLHRDSSWDTMCGRIWKFMDIMNDTPFIFSQGFTVISELNKLYLILIMKHTQFQHLNCRPL